MFMVQQEVLLVDINGNRIEVEGTGTGRYYQEGFDVIRPRSTAKRDMACPNPSRTKDRFRDTPMSSSPRRNGDKLAFQKI